MKRLEFFDEDDRYRAAALALDHAVLDVLRPIFQDYIDRGHSIREIAHLMQLAVTELETTNILTQRM
jgi:hypothetical protein